MHPAQRPAATDRLDRFRVEPWVDVVGGLVARWPGLWRYLGDLETRRLADDLHDVAIRAPVFVCGLARSGSTILLECLAASPETATHRYRDYPGVLAPVVWNRVAERLYAGGRAAMERAHGDGIAVTPDSPEAIEEMLWMAFYPQLHDPSHDNRVMRGEVEPAFATFYRDHIRKLLWLRAGRRYLSKGNYNVARLGALIELFPDARFIIPVRDPISHIASLMRQHALFSAGESRHREALRYMQRIGHFEFGLDRRPLNFGDADVTAEVRRLWQDGREVEGWSLYWADAHDHIADRLEDDPALREAALLVRFEELCDDPLAMLWHIYAHAGLTVPDDAMAGLAARIRAPDHRTLPFDEAGRRTIVAMTAPAAARLGYRSEATPDR